MVLSFHLSLPDEKRLASTLVAIYKKLGGTVSSSVEVIYTSSLAKNLVIAKKFDIRKWDKLAPYFA
jgi:elongation factor 3